VFGFLLLYDTEKNALYYLTSYTYAEVMYVCSFAEWNHTSVQSKGAYNLIEQY